MITSAGCVKGILGQLGQGDNLQYLHLKLQLLFLAYLFSVGSSSLTPDLVILSDPL